jgi:hypothetical protein
MESPTQLRKLVCSVLETANDGGAFGRPDVVARFQVWGRTWPLHRNASLTEGGEIFAVRNDQTPVAISTSFAMVFMLRAVPAFPAGMRRRESAIPSP